MVRNRSRIHRSNNQILIQCRILWVPITSILEKILQHLWWILSQPLNGRNYHAWDRAMRRAMASKNKFKFLNGSLPIPHPFDSAHEARERCNNLVHSRIVNYVSPCIAQSDLCWTRIGSLEGSQRDILAGRFGRDLRTAARNFGIETRQ